jgi:beta-glucosidase
LPGDQDALIDAIASSNPNTIVVLNVSDPVMLPWLSKVRAVVNMWYPGDSGGPATANILTGHADPGGRLPFTWVASEDQNVAHDKSHPERTSLGINFKTTYSEGIFIGYRHADKENLTPAFPFGYGLSYTSFQYSNLVTTNAPDGGLDIRFMLKNTGKRNGDEVPQIYIGPPAARPSGVQFAVSSLAAFDRVHLKAGELKLVLMHVPVRSLQYWSEPTKSWVTERAGRSIAIGASSRDMRLRGSITR